MTKQEPIDTTEKLFTRTRVRRYIDWVRVGIYAAIIGCFSFFFWIGSLSRIENMALDVFHRHGGLREADPRIVIIGITEETLDEIGKWPWPRRYHAVLARLLDQWGAAGIFFDFNFPEETRKEDDEDLIRAFRKIRTPLYLPVELKPKKDKKFWIHGFPVVTEENTGKMMWEHSLPEIEDRARAIGHRYLQEDPDGVLRRFSPSLSDGSLTMPYLALKAAETAGPETILKDFGDNRGDLLIPWLQRSGDEAFAKIAVHDLIHSYYGIQKGVVPVVSPEAVKDKICFVGIVSRSGAKATPFGTICPPVMVHAQVANAILSGNRIRIFPKFLNLLAIIALGMIAVFLFVALRGPWSLLAGLFLGAVWLCACFLIFKCLYLWISPVSGILLILSLFIFSAIYAQASGVKERSALFHLATRDGLTGLYVIRHFRLIMNQVVREARIRKEPLSVILIDIDRFKNINDTYGHPAGDMILKKVAQTLIGNIRKKRPFSQVDFAARYGGEEFIIMLRKAELKEASVHVAERLRKRVEELKIEWEGKLIRLTISAGVATLRAGEDIPDPMVHRADAALYKAKEQGRNRVVSGS